MAQPVCKYMLAVYQKEGLGEVAYPGHLAQVWVTILNGNDPLAIAEVVCCSGQ